MGVRNPVWDPPSLHETWGFTSTRARVGRFHYTSNPSPQTVPKRPWTGTSHTTSPWRSHTHTLHGRTRSTRSGVVISGGSRRVSRRGGRRYSRSSRRWGPRGSSGSYSGGTDGRGRLGSTRSGRFRTPPSLYDDVHPPPRTVTPKGFPSPFPKGYDSWIETLDSVSVTCLVSC